MSRPEQSFKYINLLLALNVTFLLVSDFTGARIISVGHVGVSVTVLYFPFTYLIGDLLTEVYGYAESRRIVWLSMLCSVIGSTVAGTQLLAPAAAFFGADRAFQTVFRPGFTIAIAGLVAFFAGDICNSYVLAKMKIWSSGGHLWARLVVATLAGEGVNTALFYGIALRGVLPGRLLTSAILMGWVIKVLVEVVMLPVTYRVVRLLKNLENVDHYDRGTDFNPFIVG
jgi:queuosine precursor transporter